MIAALTDDATFSYEIHSLVQAFYPESEVKVYTDKDAIPLSDTVFDATALPDGRDACKRALYQRLHEVTARSLPWGTLTGIRPTRIALAKLKAGATPDDCVRFLMEEYFTSEEKARLCTEIALKEQGILDKIDVQDGYSLYLGIPFCLTRCAYCSFPAYPLQQYGDLRDAYLTCLCKEIDDVARAFSTQKLQSIYIGGGTPTALDEAQLARLLDALVSQLDLSHLLEFTVECGRPDSITVEKLRVLKQFPVDRICVNPQTMNDPTLQRIGRAHTVEDVRKAFHLSRAEGFTNINMDLILGLPGEGETQVRHTMEEVAALAPDDLTVHALALKRGSLFRREVTEQKRERSAKTDAAALMRIADKGARAAGLFPYYLYRQKNTAGNLENTGFAAPGKEGIYNILINEEVQSIVALGAGSISKRVFHEDANDTMHVRIERSENVKELALYMERIDEMIGRKRTLFET